ncbi:unnamed protein product [Effrenium voratum]|nr:unnamed protein product [Effrenium voratum]
MADRLPAGGREGGGGLVPHRGDCCESKMKKDTSSPGFVADATPLRDSAVMWRPNVGWIELPRSMNVSDSYHWMAERGDEGLCPTVASPEMWLRRPALEAEARAVQRTVPMLRTTYPPAVQPTLANVTPSGNLGGYLAEAAALVVLFLLVRFTKDIGRPDTQRYTELTEVWVPSPNG